MQRINYLSDLKIVESYPKEVNKFVYHFTTDGCKCYDVSEEIGNCFKDDDKLVICLDNHGLNEGQLKVRRELNYRDTDFPDDEFNKVVENSYDIYLVDGESSDVDEIEIEGYIPIFRGLSAYEVAVQNGFEGTEREWLDSLCLTHYSETSDRAMLKTGNSVKGNSSVVVTPTSSVLIHNGIAPDYPVSMISVLDKTARVATDKSKINVTDESIYIGQNDGANLELKDGKVLVNGKDISNITNDFIEMSYQEFNNKKTDVKDGWYRLSKTIGPGQTVGYDGVAYSITYNGVIKQLFFNDIDGMVQYRSFETNTTELITTNWYNLDNTYRAGSGIQISANNTISVQFPTLKTLQGEELTGDGNINISELHDEDNTSHLLLDTSEVVITANKDGFPHRLKVNSDGVSFDNKKLATEEYVDQHSGGISQLTVNPKQMFESFEIYLNLIDGKFHRNGFDNDEIVDAEHEYFLSNTYMPESLNTANFNLDYYPVGTILTPIYTAHIKDTDGNEYIAYNPNISIQKGVAEGNDRECVFSYYVKDFYCELHLVSDGDSQNLKDAYVIKKKGDDGDDTLAQKLNGTLESYRIPDYITNLADYAFANTISLRTIDLNQVTGIGTQCFDHCENLESVDMSNITFAGAMSFRYCKSLKNVILPNISNLPIYFLQGSCDINLGVCLNVPDIVENISQNSLVLNVKVNTAEKESLSEHILNFGNTRTTIPVLSNISGIAAHSYASGGFDYNCFKWIIVPDALYDDWIVATNWANPLFSSIYKKYTDAIAEGIITE